MAENELGVKITATDATRAAFASAARSINDLSNATIGGRKNFDQLGASARAQIEAQLGLSASAKTAAEGLNAESGAAMRAAESMNVSTAAITRTSGAYAGLQREGRHVVALFDDIARGQRGQTIATLGAMFRDAGLGIGALATSFGAFVTILAGTAVVHGAESMGRWAEQVRDAAGATGMSVEAYSRLQGALVLTDSKAESADAGLRKFAQSLAQAVADPTSKASKAFNALGISQDFLKSHANDTAGVLSTVADRWITYANTATKAAAGDEIFGRSIERLGPFLEQGSKGIKALEDKANELGLTLTAKVDKALIETGENAETFSKTFSGAANKSFEAWKGPIDGFVDGLKAIIKYTGEATAALGKMFNSSVARDAHVIVEAIKAVGFDPHHASGVIGGRIPSEAAKPIVPSMEPKKKSTDPTEMQRVSNAVAQAKEAAASLADSTRQSAVAEAQAVVATLEHILATEKLTAKERLEVETELANAKTSLRNRELAEAQRVMREQAEAAKKAIQEQLQAIRSGAQTTEALMWNQQTGSKFASIISGKPEDMKANAEAAAQAIADAAQKEIAALTAVATNAEASAQTRMEAAKEVLSVVTNAEEKMAELYEQTKSVSNKSSDLITQGFLSMFSELGSAFQTFDDSVLKALIAPQREVIHAGLTTIRPTLRGQELANAARKLFMGLADDFVNSVMTGMSRLAAQGIGKLIGENVTSGEGLGGLLSQVVGGGAPQAANFGITTANLTAFNAALTTATATLGGHVAVTTTDSASTLANTTSVTANTVAETANTTSKETSSGGGFLTGISALLGFNQGGMVPSAAGGMVVGGLGGGGGGILSVLHPKEMVLPAHISEGVQRMTGQKGNQTSNNSANITYAPTINTGPSKMGSAEFGSMLSGHAGTMIGEARNMIRRGWRP